MLARYNQHALFLSQSVDKIHGTYVQVISQVGDCSGVWGNKGEIICFGPLANNRIVGVEDTSRTGEEFCAVLRRERYPRKEIALGTRPDRSVVVIGPGVRYKLGR